MPVLLSARGTPFLQDSARLHASFTAGRDTGPMIQHVLVPVDASEPAKDGIRHAVDLASQTGCRLTFCYVVDHAAITAEAAAGQIVSVHALMDEGRSTGREVLAAAVAAAAARGVKNQTMLEEGDPVETILRLAHELAPDILVMGTHGRRGISRLLLGSTTENVLRRSPVPVLVAPHPAEVAAAH